MADQKHTPGPWDVFEGTVCIYTTTLEKGAGVAMAGMAARTPEEQQANARLIAAAPELLEAVELLLFSSEWADETGYVQDVGFMDLGDIQAKARAAVTKAKGGHHG